MRLHHGDDASLRWGTADPSRVVLPIPLIRPGSQSCVNETEDLPELAMIHTDDEEATRVMPSRFGPFPHDPGKIPDVESHHQAVLLGREFQKTVVVPAI